ncbi:AAA family ATPase [Actinoplanes sp. NEAU-A12]|uniref:AAA family ATPase n=1 Tax=Actinoplanes sandaracinus TaxID=3045177 RepID=A0ABT6X034_9ACTN|nr:LuxR family transcriptional regulator [Actinoplanes sandaracinus]MDI6105357.1 AAA family ATPase [Actinoplanes sandaracinus]
MPTFCGRAALLSRIGDVLSQSRQSQGGSLFLRGESGSGRSRLLAEVGRLARSDMVVLRGRASGITPTTPFRPLAEALLQFTRSAGARAADSLGPYRLVLGRLIPEWREPDTGPEEQSLIVLAEGVLRLLVLAGRERGCLLLLDDLHDADAETLTIVEYLADNLADQPVAMVAALLDREGTALDVARSAAQRGVADLAWLPCLTRDELRDFVAARLDCPTARVGDDLLDLIWQPSAGNPALAGELLEGLVDTGQLAARPDGWELTGRPQAYVPGSLSRRLARRLETCPPDMRRLLPAAAVFGERFPLAALRTMTGLGDHDLTPLLHHGLAAELVGPVADAPGWYAFRHPVTAEALLESCPAGDSADLARQAADAVEKLHPGLPGTLCQLVARLRRQAGDHDGAGRHLIEAAHRALADGAAASAVDLLEQAAALAVDPALQADASERLVQALVEAGRIDRAMRMMSDLDGLGGGLSRQRLAGLHTRLAWAAVFAARTADGLAQVAAARRQLGADATPAETAAIDVVAAHLIIELPGPEQVDKAEALARQAASVGERHDLPVVACQAWQLLGMLVRQRNADEATACLEHSRELAVRHGLRLWEVHALVRLGNDDAARDGSLRRLRQVRRDAWSIGAVTAAHQAESSIALQVALQGRYAEADEIIAQTLPATTRLDLVETAAHLWQTSAIVAAHQGQRREMENRLAELRRYREDAPWADAKVFGLARVFCSLLEEDRPRAAAEMRSALRADGGNPALSPINGRAGLDLLLRAVAGDLDDPAVLDDGSDGVRRLRWNRQFAEMARAVLLGRRGDHAGAQAAADTAMRSAEPYPLAAHLVLRLASEAALADGWGDPVGWLRRAEEYFHEVEHAPVARACRALLRQAGVAVGQRRDGVGNIPAALRALGVTVREYEVLDLVAARLGNQEIAGRLHLSPRTVEKHVARLMAKTDRSDRASLRELARTLRAE